MESDNLVEVEVEFDYEAELSDELSLKTGEIIENVKRMDGGWWEGTLNGKRGVFPDNFVKILSRDNSSKVKSLKSSTGPQSSTTPSVEDLEDTSGVQLRRGQGSRVSANNKKKQCRVLFSYQPKHEDELKLELDDVLDFVAEVEDGWWKGKLRGRVGVFPSNFVEMIKASAPANDDEQTVADKNKRNEKLKVEKNPRPASKISSLIQEAENKAAKKQKSSIENLNLMKRESPLGGEDNSSKSDDLSNAPKLPPKPGSRQGPIPIQDKSEPNNNQAKNGGKREFKKSSGGLMGRKGIELPEIEITRYSEDFEMPPLETLSPFDFMAPLKEDDSVFFMGTLTGMAKSAEKQSGNSASSESKVTASRMIKRVLSTPKELSKSGSDRRKSIGNLFKTNKQSRRVRHSSINENENDEYDSESISSSFSSSFSFLFGGRSFGSFRGSRGSYQFKPERERSKSENHNPISITHPHVYTGIGKISRATQTSLDLGSPSIWSSRFKHCTAQCGNHKFEASTQTPDLNLQLLINSNFKPVSTIKKRNGIVTNPRIRK